MVCLILPFGASVRAKDGGQEHGTGDGVQADGWGAMIDEAAALESGERAVAHLDRINERIKRDLAEAHLAGPVDPETDRIIRLTALKEA